MACGGVRQSGRQVPILVDNRKLLEGFRRGERDALYKVYNHYVDQVDLLLRLGFIISRTGHRIPGVPDRDRRADLLQEVFARAFTEKARLSYDGVRPYRPYLLRIARNLLVDQARKSGTQALLGKQEDVGAGDIDAILDRHEPIRAHQELEDELHWKQLFSATTEYVKTLDDQLQSVLKYRFEQGHSQVKTAEILGVSRRKVRTLEKQVEDGLRRHLLRQGLLTDD